MSSNKSPYTVFLDLDGTTIIHERDSKGEIIIIRSMLKTLLSWTKRGVYIVVTTSRTIESAMPVIDLLTAHGITIHDWVCNLPVNPRVVINDEKNGERRAFSLSVIRNEGIRGK